MDAAQVILEQRDEHLQQIERTVTEAIELAANWGRAYWKASDQTRRQVNQVFFDMFLIDMEGVAGARVTPAFRSVLSDGLVERFEGRKGGAPRLRRAGRGRHESPEGAAARVRQDVRQGTQGADSFWDGFK